MSPIARVRRLSSPRSSTVSRLLKWNLICQKVALPEALGPDCEGDLDEKADEQQHREKDERSCETNELFGLFCRCRVVLVNRSL